MCPVALGDAIDFVLSRWGQTLQCPRKARDNFPNCPYSVPSAPHFLISSPQGRDNSSTWLKFFISLTFT